jgi:hypothetical protein
MRERAPSFLCGWSLLIVSVTSDQSAYSDLPFCDGLLEVPRSLYKSYTILLRRLDQFFCWRSCCIALLGSEVEQPV